MRKALIAVTFLLACSNEPPPNPDGGTGIDGGGDAGASDGGTSDGGGSADAGSADGGASTDGGVSGYANEPAGFVQVVRYDGSSLEAAGWQHVDRDAFARIVTDPTSPDSNKDVLEMVYP